MLDSAAASLFVPRQVTMLKSHAQAEENNKRAAAAAAPAPAPEKDKKKKKKRSSETLDGAPPAAPDMKARETLLISISAFLESSGFSKTLAVFRSEAQLPTDGGKTSVPKLEDLVCKFLESSTNSEDAIIDFQKEQESEKVGMHKMHASENDLDASEHSHRNKKKNSENKNLKELTSGDETDSKKSVPAEDPHVKTKDKKKKKKPAVVSLGENHSEGSHGIANTDHENDFQDHLVDEKEKRNKKQKASDPSDGKSEPVDNVKFRAFVKEKVDELKTLSSTPPAEANSKQKHEKKKKTKRSSDDSGKENVFVVEENIDDLKISKKRKRSASEERASLPENVVETKDSKHIRIEGTEDKKEVGTHQNIDKFIPDNENLPISKKRKKEKSKEGSTKTVKTSTDKQVNVLADNKEDTGASDSQKESKEHIVPNGDLEKENGDLEKEKEGGASSKTMKNKCSAETTANAFRRVKLEEVKFVDERLQNNSYWAKDGADIGYGAKAQEILGQVRGRDFRHEKTKKKRGSYRGGQIDLQSHSVKFNYSDEE